MGARSYAVERLIDAPAHTVWRLLTDAGSYDDWNDAVLSIEGPIEVGRKIKVVSVLDPKRTFTLKVDQMTEPSTSTPGIMTWSDGMPLGLFTGVRTYTVRPVSDGSCYFSMVEVFSGPMAGLITKAIPDMTDSFDQFADGLAVAAER